MCDGRYANGTAAAAGVGQEADGPYSEFARLRERERGPESLKKAGGRPCLTAPFCFLVVGETAIETPLRRCCDIRKIEYDV